jgi:hypothetical protein
MFIVEIPDVKLVRTGRRNKMEKDCLKHGAVFGTVRLKQGKLDVSFEWKWRARV